MSMQAKIEGQRAMEALFSKPRTRWTQRKAMQDRVRGAAYRKDNNHD